MASWDPVCPGKALFQAVGEGEAYDRVGWKASGLLIDWQPGKLPSPQPWSCSEGAQAFATTGSRKGAPSRLNAFIAAMAIVRSTRSFAVKAALAAA